MAMTTPVYQELVLVAKMVIQWFIDLDVMFITFAVLCIGSEPLQIDLDPFHKK